MRELLWIRRFALLGAILCFGVVVLGGYTRLSNSGLGCPDWPGCFGHIAPTGSAEHYASDTDVRKAWIEMIHRYFASTLGLIIVIIAALSIRARREPGVSVAFALVLLVLVVLQGMLGMLTVTWLLKPLIVTGHLLGGLTTFALLLWLWLSRRAVDRAVDGYLGARGQPASSRAAVPRACGQGSRSPRWPCRWRSAAGPAATTRRSPARTSRSARPSGFPEADYEDAFVVWRGLGINYAGGVLDHPARVAIHFTHRRGRRGGGHAAAAGRLFRASRAGRGTALGGPGRARGPGSADFHRRFHGVARASRWNSRLPITRAPRCWWWPRCC